MLLDLHQQDIFSANHHHIVFAVNAEGYNDAGFAGLVTDRYWPELANTGGNAPGEVLSKTVGGKTFHAIVCHNLQRNGWQKAPELIEQAMNALVIPSEEILGVVLMGGGPIGQMGGADIMAIIGAIARSNKRCNIYYR